MKDKTARALAIVALVFTALFFAAFITALVDHTVFNGSIGYIALGLGVFVLIIIFALKADGRGFSVNKMNEEAEMAEIEKALAQKQSRQNAARDGESSAESEEESNGESSAESEEESNGESSAESEEESNGESSAESEEESGGAEERE